MEAVDQYFTPTQKQHIQYLLAVGCFWFGARWLLGSLKYIIKKRKLSQVALSRKKKRDEDIARFKDFQLSDFVSVELANKLISLNAEEILLEIHSGRVKSEQVCRLFVKIALRSHQEYNTLTLSLFDEAIMEAKKLDRIFADTGKVVGPLHGLPISIKENMSMKGTDATLGFSHRCFNLSERDAVVIEALRSAGAIPFVKTNVPQTLLLPECSNPIYGTTTNPWKTTRTPGGSSGGEGALVAIGGSVLGIGTDIGGSIRIPAHFSGVYGLKPTWPRISTLGGNTAARGQEAVRGMPGPMTRSAKDIALCMKVLCSDTMFSIDPQVPRIPFRDDIYTSSKKLRIGYYTTDKFFEPSSACVRGVKEVIQKLEKSGHEVVYFDPPNVEYAIRLYFGLMSSDGSKTIYNQIKDEAKDPGVEFLMRSALAPAFIKQTVLPFIFRYVTGWKRMANVLPVFGEKSVAKVWELQHERKLYVDEFVSQMQAMGLDAIIAPGLSTPAFKIGTSANILPCLSYTTLYNLLNFPAGTVPVTRVTKDDLMVPRKKLDLWEKLVSNQDNDSVGLPIGVQVVSYPYQDEVVCRLMKEIEELIPFDDAKQLRSNFLNKLYK